MKVTHPHFRIEFPASSIGKKHRAMDGRVFVSFAETGEIELPQITNVELGGGVSDPWEIALTFIASAEVQYIEDSLLEGGVSHQKGASDGPGV